MYECGVKPPHSKALHAFAWFLGAHQPTEIRPHFFRIFRLTSPETYDSLLLWSSSGHFVAVGHRGAPMLTRMRNGPSELGNKGTENTKNNTNEASMLLKTQVAFVKRTQNEPKTKPILSA
jgi:hypothetical protein